MEVSCSFKKIVGGNCGYDPRDRNKKMVVIPLSSCELDISGHKKAFGIQDVDSEVKLLLARASILSVPDNIAELTICPGHRSLLSIGWRRSYQRCRVPQELSRPGEKKAKWPKADRGIGKEKSNTILQMTGVFVPVGSAICRECRVLLDDYTVQAKIKCMSLVSRCLS
ncbi:uncharacterized protein LOC116304705 [Actinia tenebrosa]|uniref:Uncharacterized protein LOC116304705 n=1 Tax=Actinia tenebrosa TaxID=6105 RepID=A0A6P8IT15_ACTTE|nr:uncharacterized protein LOC116304705 [Actinia tenebrosa]